MKNTSKKYAEILLDAVKDAYNKGFNDAMNMGKKKPRGYCSTIENVCPYNIDCSECEVKCSIKRAYQKAEQLKGEQE